MFHLLDAQPDVTVVDQHLVPGTQDLSDRRGRDLELAVVRRETVTAHHDHLRALLEVDGCVESADAELRPLQIADERDRPTRPVGRLADELRRARVVVVGPVGEVEPRGVHARVDQRPDALGRRGCGTDRGDDLRPARRGLGHLSSE